MKPTFNWLFQQAIMRFTHRSSPSSPSSLSGVSTNYPFKWAGELANTIGSHSLISGICTVIVPGYQCINGLVWSDRSVTTSQTAQSVAQSPPCSAFAPPLVRWIHRLSKMLLKQDLWFLNLSWTRAFYQRLSWIFERCFDTNKQGCMFLSTSGEETIYIAIVEKAALAKLQGVFGDSKSL